MPVSFNVDSSRRIVTVVYSGVLLRDDLQTLAHGLMADPNFRPDFDQLIDARDVIGAKLTRQDLEENVRLDLFGRGSRRAGVARGDLVFGMARMFEMLRGGKLDEIKIFRDLEEAWEWLEMNPKPDE